MSALEHHASVSETTVTVIETLEQTGCDKADRPAIQTTSPSGVTDCLFCLPVFSVPALFYRMRQDTVEHLTNPPVAFTGCPFEASTICNDNPAPDLPYEPPVLELPQDGAHRGALNTDHLSQLLMRQGMVSRSILTQVLRIHRQVRASTS
jgi:hypothetical protein